VNVKQWIGIILVVVATSGIFDLTVRYLEQNGAPGEAAHVATELSRNEASLVLRAAAQIILSEENVSKELLVELEDAIKARRTSESEQPQALPDYEGRMAEVEHNVLTLTQVMTDIVHAQQDINSELLVLSGALTKHIAVLEDRLTRLEAASEPTDAAGKKNADVTPSVPAEKQTEKAVPVPSPLELPERGFVELTAGIELRWNGDDGVVYLTVSKEQLRYGVGAFELSRQYFNAGTLPEHAFGTRVVNEHDVRLLFLDLLASHEANDHALKEVFKRQEASGHVPINAWKHMRYEDLRVPIRYLTRAEVAAAIAAKHFHNTTGVHVNGPMIAT